MDRSKPPIHPPPAEDLARLIDWALREDGDGRDVTSEVVVPPDQQGRYALTTRQQGVFAGHAVVDAFSERFRTAGLTIAVFVEDGQPIQPGHTLGTLVGPQRIILQIERPLLNFLQRLCGIATETHRFVEAIGDTPTRVLDTRKTIPGWRQLDKYGVRCGGGMNHRTGLNDAVLVKDNHLAGIPPEQLRRFVARIVEESRRLHPPPDFVEIEVDSLEQFREVLATGGVDRILLDNFSLPDMWEAVAMRNRMPGPRVRLEASGNIRLQTVREIAQTGVDFVSIGALTHSVIAMDISLDEA